MRKIFVLVVFSATSLLLTHKRTMMLVMIQFDWKRNSSVSLVFYLVVKFPTKNSSRFASHAYPRNTPTIENIHWCIDYSISSMGKSYFRWISKEKQLSLMKIFQSGRKVFKKEILPHIENLFPKAWQTIDDGTKSIFLLVSLANLYPVCIRYWSSERISLFAFWRNSSMKNISNQIGRVKSYRWERRMMNKQSSRNLYKYESISNWAVFPLENFSHLIMNFIYWNN